MTDAGCEAPASVRCPAEALTWATEAALDLLRRMIAIPSVSRSEADVSAMLEAYMTQAVGAPVSRHGCNLWVLSPDFDPARPTLLLCAHIDTVRPVSSWQHDPFTPSLERVALPDGSVEQRLYGLGANDDGASLVALLHAFLLLTGAPCLSPSVRAGLPTWAGLDTPTASAPQPGDAQHAPVRPNLIFLASAEEEVSGAGGVESVLPLLPPIAVGLVGEPTGMQPAVSEKGLVVLDGLARGKAGHAARDEGINAIYRAIEAVTRLRDYQFERQSPQLGPVKVSVTGIKAGLAHNQIPDECTFMVDVRTTDAYTNEETVAALQAAVVPWAELHPRSTRLQPSSIDAGHPLLRRVREVCPDRTPFGSPTLSDQALMRFPTLKMGPGQSARSHSADEYVRPDEVREAIDIYYRILSGLRL